MAHNNWFRALGALFFATMLGMLAVGPPSAHATETVTVTNWVQPPKTADILLNGPDVPAFFGTLAGVRNGQTATFVEAGEVSEFFFFGDTYNHVNASPLFEIGQWRSNLVGAFFSAMYVNSWHILYPSETSLALGELWNEDKSFMGSLSGGFYAVEPAGDNPFTLEDIARTESMVNWARFYQPMGYELLTNSSHADFYPLTTAVIPEPESYVMMLGGLLAIGSFTLRQRRRAAAKR